VSRNATIAITSIVIISFFNAKFTIFQLLKEKAEDLSL